MSDTCSAQRVNEHEGHQVCTLPSDHRDDHDWAAAPVLAPTVIPATDAALLTAVADLLEEALRVSTQPTDGPAWTRGSTMFPDNPREVYTGPDYSSPESADVVAFTREEDAELTVLLHRSRLGVLAVLRMAADLGDVSPMSYHWYQEVVSMARAILGMMLEPAPLVEPDGTPGVLRSRGCLAGLEPPQRVILVDEDADAWLFWLPESWPSVDWRGDRRWFPREGSTFTPGEEL